MARNFKTETLDASFGVRVTSRQKDWLEKNYGRQRGLFVRALLREAGMPRINLIVVPPDPAQAV